MASPILIISVIGAVLGSFQFGWNTGVINNPSAAISSFINDTLLDRGAEGDTKGSVDTIWSFIVSIFAASGLLGGLLAGVVADKMGRVRGMMFACCISIIGAPLMGFAKIAASYEMIIIGRLLVGFASGLFTVLVPIYLSEISPTNLRGALGTVNQLGVVYGILFSQIAGIQPLMGTAYLWPVLLALTGLASLIQLCILPFCPESPRYLLIHKNQVNEARQCLLKLRTCFDVEDEIGEMKTEYDNAQLVPKVSIKAMFTTPHLRRALLVVVILHLSQQLSGINNIFYYSSTLFMAVGVDQEASGYATLGVGCILVVMTLVSIPLMEKAGRRFLHLSGLAGIFACSIIFTITFALQSKFDGLKYVSVISALVFVVFFAIGPGSIPWMMAAEMFSQGGRSTAVSIGVGVNWTANFIVGLIFLNLLSLLNRLIFLPFSILTVCFLIYLFFEMPETKNRTFEEITEIFQDRGSSDQNMSSGADNVAKSRDILINSEM